ncbi:MAG: DUF4846 domain-containing protein [Chitinophagaceae bacterium]|nr:DUF4846 domain-containing protein [Chitinophagaceae bacterium]
MHRFFFLGLLLASCESGTQSPALLSPIGVSHPYATVADIALPQGYKRSSDTAGSFAQWLRSIRLKEDNTVYLYDGRRKGNQQAQFAVLDITVGEKDLQQCADAIMRLRAEYLFDQKRFNEISFLATSGQLLSFSRWQQGYRYRLKGQRLEEYKIDSAPAAGRQSLEQYLQLVFTYCGTSSLHRQLRKSEAGRGIQAGDVFLQPGFPGHAMLVMEVAEKGGERMFLLAQSYMPAQDIHVVKNPMDSNLSPWFKEEGKEQLITPEWVFEDWPLYRW